LVDERLRIAQSLNLLKEEANAWVMKGNVASSLGDLEACQVAYQHSLEISRLIGHRRSEAITLFNLGEISVEMGAWELAAQYIEQYQAISRVIGNWLAEAYAPLTLASIAIRKGNYSQAETLIERSQAIAQKNSWLRLLGIARGVWADLNFYQWLESREPTLLKQAVEEYQALEAEGKFEQLVEYAKLTLALFFDQQLDQAQAVLARGKEMSERHSIHDQIWVAALEKILSGRPFETELSWFQDHRHVSTGLFLKRIQLLL
jgi:tetratricopeptide (TPR) repeat protein